MLQNRLGKELLIFDGAMGTQLQNAGLSAGDIPEELLMSDKPNAQPNPIFLFLPRQPMPNAIAFA